MKIGIDATFILKEFDGGKDQYLFNLLEGFEKNGVGKDFVIFCRKGMKDLFKKIIPSSEIIELDVKEYQIIKILKKLGILKTGENINDAIFRSFFYKNIKEKYQINLLFFPKNRTGFLKSNVITIVIPHDIQSLTHGERIGLKTRIINYLFYSLDFKLRDYIISISEFDKKEILEKFSKYKSKVIRIYNPINIDKKIIEIEVEKPYILGINIAYEHKNIITLLKAFKLVRDKIPHNLILIGKINSYGEILKKYVEENDLRDRVIFTGYVENEKLYFLLKNSSLYVNPSIFEGFGMTAVEAMILEVPTLVAYTTAMPEVTKNLCFYYKEIYNEKELAEKIIEILSADLDRDKLKRISEVIFKEYNSLKISKDYYELFVEKIKKKIYKEM